MTEVHLLEELVAFARTGTLSAAILAGSMKAGWKFVIALGHKDLHFLNRQMRYLMPIGFLLMLLVLIQNQIRPSIAKSLDFLLLSGKADRLLPFCEIYQKILAFSR